MTKTKIFVFIIFSLGIFVSLSLARENNVLVKRSGDPEIVPKGPMEFQGRLPDPLEGRYDFGLKIYQDQSLNELLFEKTYYQVEVREGIYELTLGEEGFEFLPGKEYWARMEIVGSGFAVEEFKLEVTAPKTLRAQLKRDDDQGPVTEGQYNISGSYPFPGSVVSITNTANGYGLISQSNGGTAVYAKTTGAGAAMQATHAQGGTALLAQGDVTITNDLEVGGQTNLTNVNLPANAVGSAQIQDGTVLNADISPTASIAASKINRTGLDADLLDGQDSSAFLPKTGDVDLEGNLNVSGKVGIGTTGPSQRLHVLDNTNNGYAAYLQQTNATASNGLLIDTQTTASGNIALYLRANAGANPLFMVKNDGNVGIGTANPGYPLEVSALNAAQGNASGGNIKLTTTGGTGAYWSQLLFADGSTRIVNDFDANGTKNLALSAGGVAGQIDLRTGASETLRMRIDENGNVGIGTTTPAGILDLVGANGDSQVYIRRTATTNDNALWFSTGGVAKFGIRQKDDGTENLYIHQNGVGDAMTFQATTLNVGIGTTEPQATLDVNGAIRIASVTLDPNAKKGTITFDPEFIYIKVEDGLGGWRKARLCGLGN